MLITRFKTPILVSMAGPEVLAPEVPISSARRRVYLRANSWSSGLSQDRPQGASCAHHAYKLSLTGWISSCPKLLQSLAKR